jgi:hypothetical protein
MPLRKLTHQLLAMLSSARKNIGAVVDNIHIEPEDHNTRTQVSNENEIPAFAGMTRLFSVPSGDLTRRLFANGAGTVF